VLVYSSPSFLSQLEGPRSRKKRERKREKKRKDDRKETETENGERTEP